MSNPVQDRIRQRLEATGKSARAASIEAGASADMLRTMFKREQAIPSGRNLTGLAKALDTTEQWLLTGEDGPAPEADAILPPNSPLFSSPQTVAEVEPHLAVSTRDFRRLPDDLPVMGPASGAFLDGHEAMGGPVDYVRRPPGLTNVPDAYAIYVVNTSMVPEHRPGDLRFVHPRRPVRVEDSVVLQVQASKNAAIEVYIGHYLRRSTTHLFIGKLNPAATIEFPLSTVIAVHRVLTTAELFGV